MRIVLLCYSLAAGGAERQLAALAKGLAARGHLVDVVTYYSDGIFEESLREAGVGVISAGKRGRWDLLGFLFRLLKILRELRPNLIHAYLGSPNVLAVLLRPFCRGRPAVVWGVRASNMDLDRYDWLWRLSFRLECRLSRYSDCIIVNSSAGLSHAKANGFPAAKFQTIPNGLDPGAWKLLDPLVGQGFRTTHNLPTGGLLIGIVGRLDPMKGHRQFLAAFARLREQRTDAHAICIGVGPDEYLAELFDEAERLGLAAHVSWLGLVSDMEAAYNAIDILVSSSLFGEGFSNVVLEAMACGCPCVVTDVGDSKDIVGELGLVVPPGDVPALASGMADLCRRKNSLNRNLIRQRVIERFCLERMVKNTEAVLLPLAEGRE
jgi:glycosyltransferase involved in cell wall biosynthesis